MLVDKQDPVLRNMTASPRSNPSSTAAARLGLNTPLAEQLDRLPDLPNKPRPLWQRIVAGILLTSSLLVHTGQVLAQYQYGNGAYNPNGSYNPSPQTGYAPNGQRTDRHAGELARAFDQLRIDAFGQHLRAFGGVGAEAAAGVEAAAVVDDDRRLPELADVVERARDRLNARLLANDDLHQRHLLDRREEVNADEALRPLRRLGEAGMVGMSKSLAAEVASRNITVNCVAPGCGAGLPG